MTNSDFFFVYTDSYSYICDISPVSVSSDFEEKLIPMAQLDLFEPVIRYLRPLPIKKTPYILCNVDGFYLPKRGFIVYYDYNMNIHGTSTIIVPELEEQTDIKSATVVDSDVVEFLHLSQIPYKKYQVEETDNGIELVRRKTEEAHADKAWKLDLLQANMTHRHDKSNLQVFYQPDFNCCWISDDNGLLERNRTFWLAISDYYDHATLLECENINFQDDKASGLKNIRENCLQANGYVGRQHLFLNSGLTKRIAVFSDLSDLTVFHKEVSNPISICPFSVHQLSKATEDPDVILVFDSLTESLTVHTKEQIGEEGAVLYFTKTGSNKPIHELFVPGRETSTIRTGPRGAKFPTMEIPDRFNIWASFTWAKTYGYIEQ